MVRSSFRSSMLTPLSIERNFLLMKALLLFLRPTLITFSLIISYLASGSLHCNALFKLYAFLPTLAILFMVKSFQGYGSSFVFISFPTLYLFSLKKNPTRKYEISFDHFFPYISPFHYQ